MSLQVRPVSIVSAERADHRSGLALRVERTNAFEYSYIKLRADTGEQVWQWPNEPTLAEQSKLRVSGSLLDVSV